MRDTTRGRSERTSPGQRRGPRKPRQDFCTRRIALEECGRTHSRWPCPQPRSIRVEIVDSIIDADAKNYVGHLPQKSVYQCRYLRRVVAAAA
eukprot:2938203-Pyramimonas_sp.AAC.1